VSGQLVPPTIALAVSKLLERVTRLERRLGSLEQRIGLPELDFSFAGVLFVAASPRWYCRLGRTTITEIVASVATPGTTTTTVAVKVNGTTTAATINLTAGVAHITVAATVLLGVDDYLTCSVTAAGTGAADLNIQVRFRYPT